MNQHISGKIARYYFGCRHALASEGLDSQIESLFFTQEPVNFGLLGSVRIWVPRPQLARAQEIMAAHSGTPEGDGQDEEDEGSGAQ